ncbi:hypothetical protein PGB90_002232 [Kerria lacca]
MYIVVRKVLKDYYFTSSVEEHFFSNLEKLKTHGRETKFLTFNNDASNIRVEAVFAIPILAIPVGGKSVSTDSSSVTFPNVDINVKSIISMAGLFFMLFFVIPKLIQIYLPQKLTPHNAQNSITNNLNTITERIDDALQTYNNDIESCAQKAICWILNNMAHKIKQGKVDSIEKIIDAINSFSYLKHAFEGTWILNLYENIIHSKRNDNDVCQKFNDKCSITQNGLNSVATSLLMAMKKTKI